MLLANLAPREDYQTVAIRIFAPAAAGEAYPVELSVLRWRDFPRVFFSIDQASLNAQAADPKAYGLALGRMLFADQVLGKAYGETRRSGSGAERGAAHPAADRSTRAAGAALGAHLPPPGR